MSSEHWDKVYSAKGSEGVSWFQPHLERSLAFLRGSGLDSSAAIIDVGGGASTFADDLLAAGFHNLTVLDLSERALEVARARLGPLAAKVTWLAADVTQVELPPARYDFWHDRAVFHFLREPDARRRYVERVSRSVKPGGHVLLATFGPEGPERCSGLDVVRYDAEGLHAEFGAGFRKVSSATEVHRTPWGSEQQFVYCYCRVG
jgi:SAM-dependent methyltransferase